jgi:hypothetical protein
LHFKLSTHLKKSLEKSFCIIYNYGKYKRKRGPETINSLKAEIDHWRKRYNYVLNEKAILSREKYDLEVEVVDFIFFFQ